MEKRLFTVAFDLGGVVFSSHNDDKLFARNYLETSLVPGMYEIITTLSKTPRMKLIIISKAFPKNAQKSKEILDLYSLTNCFNSIIFCEQNNSKFPIAKAMNVDVMIDDKESVLSSFDDTIHTILFDEDTTHGLLESIIALQKRR